MNEIVCLQCGAPANDYPIILIMKYDSMLESLSVGCSPDRKWLALPFCVRCHRNPVAHDGHFFYRQQMKEALERAGSSDLG